MTQTENKRLISAAMSEAELQRFIEQALTTFGWIWHHAGDSRRSTPGLPDLVAVRAPRLIFAELKSTRGKMRPEQEAWLSSLRLVPGAEVYVWKPADLDGALELLR